MSTATESHAGDSDDVVVTADASDAATATRSSAAAHGDHPDFPALDFKLRGPSVAVIGNGNVAIDLVRVLARTAEEMKTSDLCEHAACVIHAATLTDIYMIGRRGPVEKVV